MADYQINPDFQRPDPTPADLFCKLDDPGTPEERQRLIEGVMDEWRREGVATIRVTLTGPDIEGDETGYPAGLWLEGWKDRNAVQLPFGAPWPTPESAVWPPLKSEEK